MGKLKVEISFKNKTLRTFSSRSKRGVVREKEETSTGVLEFRFMNIIK